MAEQQDWAAEIPAPAATDGPQEAVDWRLLEEERHPIYADDYEYDV